MSRASWTAVDGESAFTSRDLRLEAATGGRFSADVLVHMLDFQIVHVLEGRATFSKGDFVHQPPGIRHRVVTLSDDCELLQATSPADHESVQATGD